jgi:hypothetical protein
MRTSVEVVSHCYAKNLPQFAVFLRVQLSAATLLHDQNFKLTVCYTPDDENTAKVLRDFSSTKWLRCHKMEPNQLFRRSIGRNEVALKTEADLIWFTDVDYFWDRSCLPQLTGMWESMTKTSRPTIMWPANVMMTETKEKGDEFYKRNLTGTGKFLIPDMNSFVLKNFNRAIGGIQIVSGDYARKNGYLKNNPKWQRPNNKPFSDFREDVAFRKEAQRSGKMSLPLKGVYRLRHTSTSYQGDQNAAMDK